jgi:hypothetical protein
MGKEGNAAAESNNPSLNTAVTACGNTTLGHYQRIDYVPTHCRIAQNDPFSPAFLHPHTRHLRDTDLRVLRVLGANEEVRYGTL